MDTFQIPGNVLSVTGLFGYDTVFRATPLSRRLGLSPGDRIPNNATEADTLLWVESAVLETKAPSSEDVRLLREGLGMSAAQYDDYLGVPPGTTAGWESGEG